MTPEEYREKKRAGEKRARENRGTLPDDHPLEIQRRAEVAAQIRAENAMNGIDPRGQGIRECRCRCHAKLPDSRSRFE